MYQLIDKRCSVHTVIKIAACLALTACGGGDNPTSIESKITQKTQSIDLNLSEQPHNSLADQSEKNLLKVSAQMEKPSFSKSLNSCGRPVNHINNNATDSDVQQRRIEIINRNQLSNFDLATVKPRNSMYAGLIATAMLRQDIPDAAAKASKVVTDRLILPSGKILDGNTTTESFGMFTWLTLYYEYDCKLTPKAKSAIEQYIKGVAFNKPFFSTDNLKITQAANNWFANLLNLNTTGDSTNGMGTVNAQINESIRSGPGDWASRAYGEKTLLWLLPVMYYHPDGAVARRAQQAYESILARYGSVWTGAHVATYSPRDYGGMVTSASQSVKAMLWMYFGGSTQPRGIRGGGDGSEMAAVVFPYNLNPATTRGALAFTADRSRTVKMSNDIGAEQTTTQQYAYIAEDFSMHSLVGNLKYMATFADNVAPGIRWNRGDGGSFTFGVPSTLAKDSEKGIDRYFGIDPGSQQYMQHDTTMLWVAYNKLGGKNGTAGEKYALGRYTTAGMRVDQSCARVICNGAYRLFMAAENQPFIGVVSTKPFDVVLTNNRFTIPLDSALKGVAAVEVFGPKDFSGSTFDEKFANFMGLMKKSDIQESTRRISSGFPDVPVIAYADTKGRHFRLEYRAHWEWNQNAAAGRTMNGKELSSTWPSLESQFAYQKNANCPVFVKDVYDINAAWVSLASESSSNNASCLPENHSAVALQLRTGVDESYCIDSGTNDPDKAISNAHLWQCHGQKQQHWTFETYAGMPVLRVGNGNMCLQSSHASTNDGTDLHMWPCSLASQNRGGRFVMNANHQIVSYDAPDMCVDVPGGSAFSGNRLKLYRCHNGSNQKWYVKPSAAVQLRSHVSNNVCMNANTSNPDADVADVSTYQCFDVPQQKWSFKLYNGQPVLSVGQSGNMCLQSSNMLLTPGTQLHTWPCSESSKIPGGRYFLNSKNQIESHHQPGICVDIPGADTRNGNRLMLYTCHAGTNQKWMIE